jgi:hypothetical protein
MRRAKKLKLIGARPNTSDISSHFNRNLPTSTVDHSLITCFRVGLASLFGVESVRARLGIRQEGESRWAALVSGCASHPGNQGSILTFFVMKGSACHIFKKKNQTRGDLTYQAGHFTSSTKDVFFSALPQHCNLCTSIYYVLLLELGPYPLEIYRILLPVSEVISWHIIENQRAHHFMITYLTKNLFVWLLNVTLRILG